MFIKGLKLLAEDANGVEYQETAGINTDDISYYHNQAITDGDGKRVKCTQVITRSNCEGTKNPIFIIAIKDFEALLP